MAEFRVTTDRAGTRSFGEHDDRWTRGGGNTRGGYRGRNNYRGNRGGGGYSYRGKVNNYRGSYYRGSSNYRGRGRGGGGGDSNEPGPRSRLLDDDGDENMGETDDQQNSRRFTPYGRPPRGGYRPNSRYSKVNNRGGGGGGGTNPDKFRQMGLPIDKRSDDNNDWHKVVIPFGKKAGKDFILNGINGHLDTPFIPTYFHFEDQLAVFYVNDRRAADGIRKVSKRITMPNGYKMTILVKNSYPPNIPMGDEEVEKLKVVMSSRYDPATKALDLSSLHTDKELKQHSLYMALARPQIMTNVVKIIKENIPELVSVDLHDNKLINLEHLKPLVSSTPDLRALNLAQNKLTHTEELRKLSGWKIEVLQLDGNVLCDKFSDQAAYISAVRKVYPKVIKLDGHDLPPPITFDIEARTDLPKSKDNYFPSADSQAPIVKFLKDYFSVYDSDNRSGLAGAYHDQALFSLSVAYNGAIPQKQVSLASYLEESRNLIRTNNKDTGRKQKLLKHGNLIVPQICLLPKTTHDYNSFVVDVGIVTPTVMSFTVQGVFKEVDSKSDRPPIRAFSRTFVTVPGGVSMQIINDVLTITNASPDQVQSAFKNPAPTPSSSPVPQTAPTSPFEGAGLTEVQQKMVVSFMNDSHMNSEWSAKCLMENNWVYEKAGQVFLELQKQGKIPPEAFVK